VERYSQERIAAETLAFYRVVLEQSAASSAARARAQVVS
jgi:hypothetical protein